MRNHGCVPCWGSNPWSQGAEADTLSIRPPLQFKTHLLLHCVLYNNQVLEADINNKIGMFELEKKSWKNDKEAYKEEIKRLQEQILSKENQDKE